MTSSSPVKRLVRGLTWFGLVLALGAIGCSSPASPTKGPQTVYVSPTGNDANNGEINSPWRTLSHAVGQLKAGDTLYLRQGTYAEELRAADFRSTGLSWGSPITIAAYGQESVTLRPAASSGNVVQFPDGNVRFVVIQRLILDGISAGGGAGGSVVYLGGSSHHIRLSQVEITNGDGNGVLGAGHNHEFLNLNVHYNGLFSGYSNSNGMYLTTSDSLIEGGDIYNNEGYGVRFLDSDLTGSANNNIVRAARIYNNGYGVGLNGLSVCSSGGGGVVLGDVNNLAQDNVIHENYEGVLVFGSKPSLGASIINNTVFANAAVGIQIDSGSVNAQITGNNAYANGIADILDRGSATRLLNNTGSVRLR